MILTTITQEQLKENNNSNFYKQRSGFVFDRSGSLDNFVNESVVYKSNILVKPRFSITKVSIASTYVRFMVKGQCKISLHDDEGINPHLIGFVCSDIIVGMIFWNDSFNVQVGYSFVVLSLLLQFVVLLLPFNRL